ncbi:MAG TPA: hypothetical protein VMS22_15495 [Candidatus Eisenbacteria bacterium]|nr:hypothetical protein [Candidatus Eisenbacteria bacterium]
MTNAPVWPLLLLTATLGACSAARSHPSSHLEWQKASDVATPLVEARRSCKVQTAADTLGTPERPAAVDADFVKCMRAAGWTLLDHGTE